MSRRNPSKNDIIGTIELIIIGIPVLLFNWITENKAWGWVIAGIIIVVTIIIV